jgi:5-methylcytosine-specific restriction endonuclease McrA
VHRRTDLTRQYTCTVCGTITDRPQCAAHRADTTRRSHQRDGARHMRFQRAVLKRDGHRCQRCGATTDLRACHHPPLAAYLDPNHAYNPRNGITLCGNCDRATDPHAR